MSLIVHGNARHGRGYGDGGYAGIELISRLQLYLKGFLKRRNRPKTAKKSHNYGKEKYEGPAFTMATLIIMHAYAKYTAR
jgi:hypothetical protein